MPGLKKAPNVLGGDGSFAHHDGQIARAVEDGRGKAAFVGVALVRHDHAHTMASYEHGDAQPDRFADVVARGHPT